jgi:hypothetical protein
MRYLPLALPWFGKANTRKPLGTSRVSVVLKEDELPLNFGSSFP